MTTNQEANIKKKINRVEGRRKLFRKTTNMLKAYKIKII